MSKRRNRSQSPNLPPEMLERARQQLGKTDAAEEMVEKEVQEVVSEEVEVKAEAPKPAAAAPRPKPAASTARPRSNRRGGLQPAQSRGERKTDSTDTNYIRSRLEHPTRFVTKEQLKEEYSYVISDLRTMGILAAVLLVAMVVIEKLLG